MAKKEPQKINGAASADQRDSAGEMRAEKYKAIQIEPEFTDYEDVYRMAVERLPRTGGKVVEVGSFIGKSAVMMLELLESSGKEAEFTCVDPFVMDAFINENGAYSFSHWANTPGQSSAKGAFLKHLKDYKDKYALMEAESPAAAETFGDATLDFVFVDGMHDYESVRADILAWLPKLKPGALLAGHDFTWDFPDGHQGVAKAVHQICRELGIAYGVSRNSWYFFTPQTDPHGAAH